MKNLFLSLLFYMLLCITSLSGLFAHTADEPQPQLMEIDVELQMDSPTDASIYTNYPVILTMKNKGPATATDVVVRFTKPSGVVYAGGNEYNATTGTFYPYDNEHWTVPSLDSGAIATLTVNYFLLQNDLPIAYAEVISANEPDIDSTPDNGTPPYVNEDDEASSVAVVICSGDVFLESQADVDAFAGCNIIEGNLFIGYLNGSTGVSSDINDLSPLLSLTKVGGNLQLGYNDLLVHLNGLDNIVSIGKSLVIQSCDNLIDLNPLSGLSGELDYLVIQQNSSLLNIDGLHGISKLNQGLDVSGNNELINVNGLANLSQVNVDFLFSDNPSLTSIQGLNNLNEVGNDLIIVNCDGLENLYGLEGLNKAGSFILSSNDVLSDVNAVSNLSNVEHTLFIGLNPLLSDCCIFNDLLQNNGVGGTITIENNAPNCNSQQEILDSCNPIICTGDVVLESQADVDAFLGCSVIEGSLIIQGPSGSISVSSDIHDLSPLLSLTEVHGTVISVNNDSLFNLNGLNNLTHLERLVIIFNDNLENIQALSNLTGEIEDLFVFDNAALENLDGLEGITGLSKSFELKNNSQLENINGLSGLEYITGSALLEENPLLNSISGLGKLASVGINTNPTVGNHLVISKCDALQSLDGLDNLATAGLFIISENATLQDVGAVKSLVHVEGDFGIGYNPLLEDCCIFLDLLNSGGIGGVVSIENNAVGCNSESDILDNCQPSGIDLELSMNSPSSADIYTTYPVELTVTNTGGIPATGIQIEFSKPAAVVYAGGNPYSLSAGSFSVYGNQIWTINNLEANATATLTVNYFLLQNDLPAAYAQVMAANEEDEDSIPGNGTPPLVNEDDEASSGLGGQVICIGDIYLESQEDVNNFPECTVIDGDLFIQPPSASAGPSSDIVDLSPLNGLIQINGRLILINNDSLFHLQGLEGIHSIEGLSIVFCDNLNDIHALSGITGETGSITLLGNSSLPNLDGLSGITSLMASLYISENTVLQNLNGFSSLVSVSNSEQYGFEISDNPSLNDLSGLSKLKDVGGNFVISRNTSLENLNGLNNLTTAKRSFAIVDNDNLQDVSALSALNSVQEVLAVQRNPILEDCCIFYNYLNNNGDDNVYIQDNAGNCNSPADILTNCIPTGDIDLSLSISTTNPDPAIYTSVPVTLTVTNDGPLTATGVSISFPRPNGTVYTGGNEYTLTQGTFNTFNSELWNVGDLPAGGSASLTVNYFFLNENTMTPYAQVISHIEQDVDSAPDNGTCCTPMEDDETALTLNAFQPGSILQLTTRQNRYRLSIDQVYPNPTKYWVTLDVYAQETGMVLFDFYNVTGQPVHRIELNLDKGQNEVRVDVSEWRSGTYTVIGRGLGHPAYGRFLKVWE